MKIVSQNSERTSHSINESAPIVFPSGERYVDIWVTQDAKTCFSTAWAKVKRSLHSFLKFLKYILCFGFCCKKTEEQQSLARLKKAYSELRRRIPRVQEGTATQESLQKWWAGEFHSLVLSVRKKLFLEYAKFLKEGTDHEKEEWAKANLSKLKKGPENFVVNLYEKTVRGVKYDPLDKLPDFIEKVIE